MAKDYAKRLSTKRKKTRTRKWGTGMFLLGIIIAISCIWGLKKMGYPKISEMMTHIEKKMHRPPPLAQKAIAFQEKQPEVRFSFYNDLTDTKETS